MSAGVPQGSVLGPLLWNIAFDFVLRLEQEEGCRTVCYADDTLIVSTSSGAFDAVLRANIMAARVVRRIRGLGLSIAAQKTEAVYFYGKGKEPRVMPTVYVDNAYVTTTTSMKYLDVMIDSRWSFQDHFRYIETKTSKVSRALFRLMPNLRCPHEGKRKLYANVLTSVITYAAPVWSDVLSSAFLRTLQPIIKLQKSVAIRVVSAYRTLSFDIATLLARMPPWVLQVSLRCRVYGGLTDLRTRGEWTKEAVAEIKTQERTIMNRQWSARLNRPGAPGTLTRDAIMPHFSDWLGRNFGSISFRLTQLITEHGCFGHYLYRMRKRDSPACLHCTCLSLNDTVEHTIF
ncbi:reverse transcriptase [Lasius niger]|uniref:Reverse transcriptase n=1 Tax=Lasius niger TaxID=67767 RepID=A0A0J7KC11_LASNI|nr:reverse transcriptase [Lasius niger]